jgi:hypothetical protein
MGDTGFRVRVVFNFGFENLVLSAQHCLLNSFDRLSTVLNLRLDRIQSNATICFACTCLLSFKVYTD